MHIILLYIGILIGIFLEGEMIMISSIIAAHHGYLNIWIVLVIGIGGTYCSDVFYFLIGKNRGRLWIKKNPRFSNKVDKIDKKIQKYPFLIFVVYRFLYGFRTITPLLIGTTPIKTRKFLILSAASTIIWAITYSTLGYLFGEVIKAELGQIENIEKYIIGSIILIGIIIFLIKQNNRAMIDTLTNRVKK